MTTELTLGVISFLTSTVAGVVGIGGGMMLITILPSFLPLNALIPVHGLTQMSSNFSRAVFGYKDVQFEVIPKFLLGSFVGIGIFAAILNFISLEYVPVFIGFYILLSLYTPKHGYAVMQFVEEKTGGRLSLGAGTLYGALNSLQDKKWIEPYGDSEGRKKEYHITAQGKEIAEKELARLNELVRVASEIIGEVQYE